MSIAYPNGDMWTTLGIQHDYSYKTPFIFNEKYDIMGKNMDKKQLIQEIEALRNSRVITYLTSDRQGPFSAKIATDIIPLVAKQLKKIGKTPKIDLFIYSTGGDTFVPWRLVSMIRDYCETFSVLVPYKAHSAATMIALGADEIVMTNLSELSPIDPSTANVFNPVDSHNPGNRIPISVEDVMAYFDLAKNKFGIKTDEDLTKIFTKFVEANPQVHPLALGNVNRIHNLIRMLARRLLKSHTAPMKDDDVEKVVDYFTEKLYSHQYFVGRKEAKEELNVKSVVYADDMLAQKITDLYDAYAEDLEFGKQWNPEMEVGLGAVQNKKTYIIAYIESTSHSNHFEIEAEFKKQQMNVVQQTPQGPINIPQEQVGFRVVDQGWR
jgi:ClpP class serine protease